MIVSGAAEARRSTSGMLCGGVRTKGVVGRSRGATQQEEDGMVKGCSAVGLQFTDPSKFPSTPLCTRLTELTRPRSVDPPLKRAPGEAINRVVDR